MDPCKKANEALRKKLDELVQAINEGNGEATDRILKEMVKLRKGMELGGCPIEPRSKPFGFRREENEV